MKFSKIAVSSALSAVIFSVWAQAATNQSVMQQYRSYENKALGMFGKGRVIKAANNSKGYTWVYYNEGHLGYSFSNLGPKNNLQKLHSADIGYSAYIMSYNSAGGARPFVGIEATALIYLKNEGNSNAFHNNSVDTAILPNGTKLVGETGFSGWGVQLPAVVGLQMGAFYVQAMAGYSYHNITDTFYKSEVENNKTLENSYHGVIYGGGFGWRMTETFSIGFRYIMGDLKNSARKSEYEALSRDLRSKDVQVPYWRASVIAGVVF